MEEYYVHFHHDTTKYLSIYKTENVKKNLKNASLFNLNIVSFNDTDEKK